MRARARTRTRVCMRVYARMCAREVWKFIEHILDGLHQLRAVLDQAMSADGQWILDASRNAEHLTSLLQRHARRDQCSAAFGRLDDDHAQAEPADDPVAHRKVAGQR